MIEPCPELSLQRQCELIGISRSGIYYEPVPESPENLALMRRLDELYLEHPVYGSRRLTAVLRREGRQVNRKRVARLLGLMGLEVAYPKRNLSQPGEGHRIYPYLLEGLQISGPDQVWCSDITYVPMAYQAGEKQLNFLRTSSTRIFGSISGRAASEISGRTRIIANFCSVRTRLRPSDGPLGGCGFDFHAALIASSRAIRSRL